MVTVPVPKIIVTHFHRYQVFKYIHGCKAIIKVVGLVLVPVQVKRWMLFFALRLMEVLMVNTENPFFLQPLHNRRMVALPSGPVPDGIAIEVPDQYCPLIVNDSVIMVDGFPNLCYVLPVWVIWIVGPNSKEVEVKLPTRHCHGNNHFETVIMNVQHVEPEIAV